MPPKKSQTLKKQQQLTVVNVKGEVQPPKPVENLGDGKFASNIVKIASWNVNGIRASTKNESTNKYLHASVFDVICLNELKIDTETFTKEGIDAKFPKDYFQYMNFCKEKSGYSGVGMISKVKPISVFYDIGIEKHDKEGRVITAEFEKFNLVAVYVPNAGDKLIRLNYRTKEWDVDFQNQKAGKVFKGVEKVTNREVAIKVIQKADFVDDEVLQKALLDEMQLMSKLKHQNIVQLLNVISSDSNYYIVYEFCKQDLYHQLKTQHKLPESAVMKLITDLLQGCTELIKQGIIHRDIKLTNILIQNDTYKLADCGFTRTMENFTKQNKKEFNLFMSPQVLQGEKYTSKCDIWSLGVVIYNCIYGYTPWFGKKIEELVHNIQFTMLDFPESQVKVSRDLQSFIEGCLSVEEEARFNWDDVFSHKLVKEHFKLYKSEIKEQQINFLMNDVRQKIVKQNIDIIKLFKELDKSGDQSLQFSEFVVLLRRIDPKMSRNDMQQIFKKLDLDGNKDISFEEFTKWLTQNNTKMTLLQGKFKPRGSLTHLDGRKKTPPPIVQQPPLQPAFAFVDDRIPPPQIPVVVPNQFIQPQQFPPQPIQQQFPQSFVNQFQNSPQSSELGFGGQNSIEKTILKIKQSIQKYNIDIYQLFVKYDQDRDNFLNFNEFGALVNKINPKLPLEDAWQVFRIFDLNEDQFISFIEFKQVLNLTVDKPPQLNWSQAVGLGNPLGGQQFAFYQQPQFQQQIQQQQQFQQPQQQNIQQMFPQQQMMKNSYPQPQPQFSQPLDKPGKFQQGQIVEQLVGKPAQKNDQPKNPYAYR